MADILVDGYNVIKNNMMFHMMEVKDFSYARALLVKQLYNKYRQSSHSITVVFDGAGSREQITYQDHIRIIYSRYDETADRVISRLAEEARKSGREVMMYSDDEEIRQAIVAHGGQFRSTHKLTKQLSAPSHDVAIRSAHRREMRRVYGIDPAHKAIDEEDALYHIQGKKRKKSRRHR